MRIARLSMWVAAVAIGSLCVIGCTDPKDQQIKTLQDENTRLTQENMGLKSSRDLAQEQVGKLQGELDDANRALAAARAAGTPVPATAPAPTVTAEGWEKGLIGDRVTVGTDILFKSGQATLTPEGKKRLDEIAHTINTTYKGLPLIVYGYTDNDPIRKTKDLWDDNLDLSAGRAMAVTRYLWSQGVPKDLLDATARGDTHFVAANSSKAGKAKNRRVEIIVIKEGATPKP